MSNRGNWSQLQFCSAKPKCSICLLEKKAILPLALHSRSEVKTITQHLSNARSVCCKVVVDNNNTRIMATYGVQWNK